MGVHKRKISNEPPPIMTVDHFMALVYDPSVKNMVSLRIVMNWLWRDEVMNVVKLDQSLNLSEMWGSRVYKRKTGS